MTTGANSDNPPSTKSVFLVEDHPIVVQGIQTVIATFPGFRLVGHATTAADARTRVRDLHPDLCITDLILSNSSGLSDGLSLLADLRYESPATSVLIFSSVEENTFAKRAFEAGAKGYMVKSEPLANLELALKTIAEGRVYLSPRLFASTSRSYAEDFPTSVIGKNFGVLTNRELLILHAIGLELPNRRIASDLGISVKTVEAHKETIKRKLEVPDSAGLSRLAHTFLEALRG